MIAAGASERFEAWLAGLNAAARAGLARRYQRLALHGGAYVLLSDGARVAIPPILTPIVVEDAALHALARDASLLLRGLSRVAGALLATESAARERLLAPLSPLERSLLGRTHRDAERLATARIDFLLGRDGIARALEINATIPAMQGYSDAMAEAFLRASGEARGLAADAIERVVDANGRNADDLLASLLAHHAATGGVADRPCAIAIVARAADAQSGELDHYARRWQALGHDVWRVTPAEVAPGPDGPIAAGRRADLLYRHVFVRRVDPALPFAEMLAAPRTHRIWNPPASHLELKGMLALLSIAGADDAAAARAGLTSEEREAAARRLPWTRPCHAEPSTAPDGSPVPDLLAFARAHGPALVLKRSWDYGGRGVFLGAELDAPGTQARLRELTGTPSPIDWRALLDHVERSGEAWVMQSLVDVAPRSLVRVEDAGPVARTLYADLSAFTSLGNGLELTGGAVRASGSRVVNIQGGGGLAPLVRESALARLWTG